ncbi:fumarate/nitrate reduction transcriptional regulator Fnr [Ramlibacter monticola]|uniref:Helix-turn-helix domain-containing protein n=1 Tax=Ramlibacter monticola TaxID=1926872 RepID=A0A936Z0Y0_9BURK|nr:helix-turn-helix domain-containing protein [Ramlibacter monticola]MBL0393068.1 helix-turn-helix domain-containing protein [Ramlibacter monticola]
MDFTTSSRDVLAAGGAQLPPAPARTPSRAAPAPQCVGCGARQRCLPAGLSEHEARCLHAVTIGRRRVRKGQALYREGERFLFLYAVRFGTFKSTAMLNSGSDQVTGFHLPGDVMGFDATVSNRHPTTATALEDAEACALPYSQLTDACAEERSLRMQMLRLAGAELVRDQRLLALIAHTHSEQRVAAFLLSLSQRMRERGFSPSDFLLRMTRAEIGSYLGTTLETVSRSLSAFARRGFITVRRRQIHLADLDALRAEFETDLP